MPRRNQEADNRADVEDADGGTARRKARRKRGNSVAVSGRADQKVPDSPATPKQTDELPDRRNESERESLSDGTPPKMAKRAVDTESIPPQVRDRFVQVRREYFLPDGTLAFKDHGRRLTTQSENTAIVRSLIQIAEARGWNEIVVSGTPRFRRAAWEAAQMAGLSVRGYSPTEVEQARRAHGTERRNSRNETRAEQSQVPPVFEPGTASAAEQEREAAQNHRSAVKSKTTGSAASGPSGSNATHLIKGELVDHGRATYLFHPQEEMSYFARVKTAQGERTFWGKDLERALAQAETRPEIGHTVGLVPTGRDRVTVVARDRNQEGRLVGGRAMGAHRNRWIVERVEFFEDREGAARTLRDTRIAPSTGVERHPDLVDAYLHVRAAEEVAAKRIANPRDRQRFVSLVREALAAATARGENLPEARVRSRVSETARRPPDLERSVAPVR